MLRFVLLTLVASSVFTASCLAQKVDSAQQLRTFGDKMVEGTWHQTFPKNVDSKHTYKWALGNQFLLVYLWHEDKPDALAVIGVDSKTKLQTWWRFQDDGDIKISSVDVESLTPTTDRVNLAGDKAVGTGAFEVAWKDTDTLEITPQEGATQDGKAAGRESWKRSDEADDLPWIDAEAPTTIPDQLALARHFSGKKWIDGVMPDGTKFVGASHGKWILDGRFHISTESTAKSDQTTWSHLVIMGIDPTTKKAASWEFTSFGARSEITFDKGGMTIYGANTQSNGDEYSFEGQFTVDGNTLRYRSKIGQQGEEPKPYGWNYRDAK